MFKLIENLIEKWACNHDWKQIEHIKVSDDFGGSYHKFLFVCKKCGKFKWIKSN